MSIDNLSPRERQVMAHLVQGRRNNRIAFELKIASGTVKVHLKSIYQKLRVETRTQAVITYLKSGGNG